MGKAKSTRVLLVVPEHGIQQDFSLEHAERLLRMPRNGGWRLPKDSKFELTENGLKYRANTERDKRKQEGTSSK
jgi:hypothetical protein